MVVHFNCRWSQLVVGPVRLRNLPVWSSHGQNFTNYEQFKI